MHIHTRCGSERLIRQAALGHLSPSHYDFFFCKYEIFYILYQEVFLQFKGNCFPKDIQFLCFSFQSFEIIFSCFSAVSFLCTMHSWLCTLQITLVDHTCTERERKCLKYSILNIQYMKHIFCCILMLKCILVDLNIENKLCNKKM